MKADAKFRLTEYQAEIIAPLVERIDKESDVGEESVIVAQLLVWTNDDIEVKAKWLDGRGAAIMQRAIRDIEQLPKAEEAGDDGQEITDALNRS